MNTKKCLALILALMLALALVACGEKEDASNGTTNVPTTETATTNECLALFEESIATFMDHLVNEVPRESWDEVMSEMPWSYQGINSFDLNDTGLHGDDTWFYYQGQFCVMADSWHFIEWSYNVKCDVAVDAYDQNRTFSLEDNTKDGYMLFLLGDYYFYLVEISSTRETQVTCLEDYTLDGFYTIWGQLSHEANRFLDNWSADPHVTEDVLKNFYFIEQDYSLLSEYAALIENQENRKEALSQIECGYCHDPIVTFLYDEEYRDFTFAILDGGMWDMQYTHQYANGIYTLRDNYFVTVEWTMNIQTDSIADDFGNIRTYEIIDPTKDAYILIHGDETGYTLVRIVAKGNNSVHTADTNPVYTLDEFKRLYYNIADNCDESLAELAETGKLTEECLQYLRINAEDHEEVCWYGEHLTGKDLEYYQAVKGNGYYDAPLVEIDLSDNAAGHLYTYADGILTLESPYLEIVCTDNIADVQWDAYDHNSRHFIIDDTSKPAFVQVLGEGGYSIYYLTTG